MNEKKSTVDLKYYLNEDKKFINKIFDEINMYENMLQLKKNNIPNKNIVNCEYCKKSVNKTLFKLKYCNYCTKYCCQLCLVRSRIIADNTTINICNKCNRLYYINILNNLFFNEYKTLKLFEEENKKNYSLDKIKLELIKDTVIELKSSTKNESLAEKNITLHKKIIDFKYKIEELNIKIEHLRDNDEEDDYSFQFKKNSVNLKKSSILKIKGDNVDSNQEIKDIQKQILDTKLKIKYIISSIRNKLIEGSQKIYKNNEKNKNYNCKCIIF